VTADAAMTLDPVSALESGFFFDKKTRFPGQKPG